MNTKTYRGRASLLVLAPLAALLAACGDGPTEHSDELHVHGVVLSDMGVPVVTVDDGVVTGSLSVAAGDETPDYDIVFMDHDGEPITSGLAGFTSEGTVANTGFAIFHSTGDHRGHFEGLAAGTTEVTIQLLHTADGDAHYDSPAISLTVN